MHSKQNTNLAVSIILNTYSKTLPLYNSFFFYLFKKNQIPSRDMFERSNPEAFQAVMYFLFHKLDPNVAAKKFV